MLLIQFIPGARPAVLVLVSPASPRVEDKRESVTLGGFSDRQAATIEHMGIPAACVIAGAVLLFAWGIWMVFAYPEGPYR